MWINPGHPRYSSATQMSLVHPLELKIDDVAFGGNGVGRLAGKAVFVPFTIDGEKVTANIIHEKKQFCEGELVEVVTTSPNRAIPQCPYFGECGGCSYQHIDYEHQLVIKARQVEQAMQRIGRLKEPPMRSMIRSRLPYGYRNRITVHADNDVIGFYRRDHHQLMDIEHCPIAMSEVNAALTQLRARPLRDGHYTLRAHSGPRVFAQTNDGVAEDLVSLIAANLPAEDKVLIDAYCGSGFFTKRLADRFERVVGIDWDRFAIEAALKNSGANETYIAGDVTIELPGLLQQNDLASTALIVDPPATGLSAELRDLLLAFAVHTLHYVSCNPPTMARDLATLQRAYQVSSITPLDMFPQTAEIEVVAHLQRA